MRVHMQPDHTKPTIAFIVLVVLAAATVGQGLSGRGADVVAAVDTPGAGGVATPVPDPHAPGERRGSSSALDLAAVVTLAARPVTTASKSRETATPRPSTDASPGPLASSGGQANDPAGPSGATGPSGGSGAGTSTGGGTPTGGPARAGAHRATAGGSEQGRAKRTRGGRPDRPPGDARGRR